MPFLVKLVHEIRKAAELLLIPPHAQSMLEHFKYKNKKNPEFSTLAYLLYEVEDKFLKVIIDEVKQHTKLEPLTLMFDGAIISCTS